MGDLEKRVIKILEEVKAGNKGIASFGRRAQQKVRSLFDGALHAVGYGREKIVFYIDANTDITQHSLGTFQQVYRFLNSKGIKVIPLADSGNWQGLRMHPLTYCSEEYLSAIFEPSSRFNLRGKGFILSMDSVDEPRDTTLYQRMCGVAPTFERDDLLIYRMPPVCLLERVGDGSRYSSIAVRPIDVNGMYTSGDVQRLESHVDSFVRELGKKLVVHK